jgi:hypothetical protein
VRRFYRIGAEAPEIRCVSTVSTPVNQGV